MAFYRVRRGADHRVRCDVVRLSGHADPLPHLVRHSPDGFELGYAGSGPSDLARSIIGHYLDEADPSPRIYQTFKFAFLADPTTAEALDITVGAITRWLEQLPREAS